MRARFFFLGSGEKRRKGHGWSPGARTGNISREPNGSVMKVWWEMEVIRKSCRGEHVDDGRHLSFAPSRAAVSEWGIQFILGQMYSHAQIEKKGA